MKGYMTKHIFMTQDPIRQASLFFKEGSSDKVYFAKVTPEGSGCVVTFSYGRRGSALQHGSKTGDGPVAEAKAIEIFDKLVKEKTTKGYKPMAGEVSSPEVEALVTKRVDTGLRSQLPIKVKKSEAERLISDDLYLMQEKMDGHHKMSKAEGTELTTANKKGQSVSTPSELAAALLLAGENITLDYEHIGDTFHVFDLLTHKARNLRSLGYEARYLALAALLAKMPAGSPVKLVRAARTSAEKRALWDEITARDGEGVVFKLKSQPFAPGKVAEGAMLKCKFYETLSAIVDSITVGKRSISVSLFGAGAGPRVAVGKCTIPSNKPIPAVGDVVEIRYLYAYRGGSLYQSTYIGPRDDVDQEECTMDQLKFKPEGGDEE